MFDVLQMWEYLQQQCFVIFFFKKEDTNLSIMLIKLLISYSK